MPARPLILPPQRTDWCTPQEIVDAVYKFFGGIPVLDPCGAKGQILRATRVVMLPENGLEIPWRGTVFCNPPYGRGIDKWIEKATMSSVAQAGKAETLLLVPAAVGTQYWRELVFPLANAICFLTGRLNFVGGAHTAGFSSAVLYYGSYAFARFEQVFGEMGYVFRPY